VKIAHIISPVIVPKSNNLYFAQPITFESMRNAKAFCLDKQVEIIQCTAQFEEDKTIIPPYFYQLKNLNKSVNEVNNQLNRRKLPLIADILNQTKEIKGVDYVIYTNVDIALMPHFYDSIIQYIELGYDSIIINRRRLEEKYNQVAELPLMYAELGKSHPGFDCFIFKQSLIDKLKLNHICIGVPFLEVSLLHNLLAYSNKPIVLFDKHLTFHIGMDVLGFNKDEYYRHNKEVYFSKIYPQIKHFFDINKFPYSKESKFKRLIKWGLNPSLLTIDYLNLEGKSQLKKIKLKLDELRWRFLQR